MPSAVPVGACECRDHPRNRTTNSATSLSKGRTSRLHEVGDDQSGGDALAKNNVVRPYDADNHGCILETAHVTGSVRTRGVRGRHRPLVTTSP